MAFKAEGPAPSGWRRYLQLQSCERAQGKRWCWGKWRQTRQGHGRRKASIKLHSVVERRTSGEARNMGGRNRIGERKLIFTTLAGHRGGLPQAHLSAEGGSSVARGRYGRVGKLGEKRSTFNSTQICGRRVWSKKESRGLYQHLGTAVTTEGGEYRRSD